MAWRCMRGFLQSEDEEARGGAAKGESPGEGQLQLPCPSAAGRGEEEAIKATLEAQVKELNHQVARLKEQLKKQDQRVEELEAAASGESEATVEAQAKERNHQVARLKEQLKKQDQHVKELEAALKGDSEAHVEEHSHQEARLKEELKLQDQRGMELKAAVKDENKVTVEAQAKERNHQVARLKEKLKKQDQRVKELEAALKGESEARARLELALAEERRGKEGPAPELREAWGRLAERTLEASEEKLTAESDIALGDLESAQAMIEVSAEEEVAPACTQPPPTLDFVAPVSTDLGIDQLRREADQCLFRLLDIFGAIHDEMHGGTGKEETFDTVPADHSVQSAAGQAHLSLPGAEHRETAWAERPVSPLLLFQHLEDAQRLEARKIAQKLVDMCLSPCASLEDIAQQLGIMTSDKSTTWRNIRYGTESNRRLDVWEEPRQGSGKIDSVPFGARLSVEDKLVHGNDVWLQLGSGVYKEKKVYVLAQSDDIIHCVEIQKWLNSPGQIPDHAYAGQDYPIIGMYTEGYAGSHDVCLVSASGDAFWRDINLEMLFRDMATATVFEQRWGGSETFTVWVAYYAANVVMFTGGRTGCMKKCIVTVKPTARWSRYQDGQCIGPEMEEVIADLGRAQIKECTWLHDNRQRLQIDWKQVQFMTAFSFLKRYCKWSEVDCRRAAASKLFEMENRWESLSSGQRQHEFQNALWCIDEAFDGKPIPKQLGTTIIRLLAGSCMEREALICACENARTAVDVAKVLAEDGNRHVLMHMAESDVPFAKQLMKDLNMVLPADTLYALGGFDRGGLLASAERFDPALGAWEPLPRMAQARESLAAAALGGRVYALGGEGGGFPLAWAERFDPALGAWEPLPRMAEARKGLAAAALGGRVYALGGRGAGGGRGFPLASAERFDPALGAWEPLPRMAQARRGLAAAALGGRVYALGGEGGGDCVLASAERFDPALGAWEPLPDMAQARSFLAAAALGGRVYALGGCGGSFPLARSLASAERFDPALGAWEPLPDMAEGRWGLAAAALGGRVYALGGCGGNSRKPGSVEQFDPELGAWVKLPPMAEGRFDLAVAAVAALDV